MFRVAVAPRLLRQHDADADRSRRLFPLGDDLVHGRIIGIDRPGTGLSTRHLYQNMADFAPDVAILMDELGVGRFAVVGLSGGGPYTLSLAHGLPDRVAVAGVLGGGVPNVGDEGSEGGVVGFLAPIRPLLPLIGHPVARVFQVLVKAIKPVGTQALDLFGGVAAFGHGNLSGKLAISKFHSIIQCTIAMTPGTTNA